MSDDQARWFFVRQDPNDRVRSTARRHALEGSGLPTEARIVREAIQNSVDATRPDAITDVLIWQRAIEEDEIGGFRQLLGFEDPDSPFARLAGLGLPAGNAIERMQCADRTQGQDSLSFEIVIIEDRNTCGLGYDADSCVDRFEELCLSHGQDTTSATGARGGSYGFGKGVYEEASNCNTFLVYSAFEASDQVVEHGSHARLFGCATFDGHRANGAQYTGRALFGVHKPNDSGNIECRPLVDDAAHKLASELGFVKRDPNDLGTSIMIVGANLDMAAIRAAIEDWWWPRILSNRLSSTLVVGDDEQPPPDPRDRGELEPYITCYSLIEEGIPKEPQDRLRSFRRVKGSKLGRLALTPGPAADDTEADEDSEEDSRLTSTVALIRNGPRMVVRYLDPGGWGSGSFAGVFLSDHEADEALHLSEPPAHNDWDSSSQRLRDAYPAAPEKRDKAVEIVRTTMRRIKRNARDFRRTLHQTPPPTPVDGDRTLRQLLGRIMSARSPGLRPPPPPGSDPFELRIYERRENSDGDSRVVAKVELGLKPDAPTASTDATASLRPVVVLDDNRRREKAERVPLASLRVDGKLREPENGFDVPLTLVKGTQSVIELRSEAFHRDLYASLDVGIQLREHPAAES